MRAVTVVLRFVILAAAVCGGLAQAKLPEATATAKAAASETAAKSAWSDKVAAYKLCMAMDKTAESYRKSAAAAGKAAPPAIPTPPCGDPGPYVSPVAAADTKKPIEASGAHSPPGTASSPPSTNATSAEIAGGVKK